MQRDKGREFEGGKGKCVVFYAVIPIPTFTLQEHTLFQNPHLQALPLFETSSPDLT